MKERKIVINLPPVTKKNSCRILLNRRTGKPFIAPSKKYAEYEKNALWFCGFGNVPIDYPVNIKCLFFMPTKRRCDLTNLLEAIDDILVSANVISDDNYNILWSHDGSRVLYSKEHPRTEIFITDATDFTKY